MVMRTFYISTLGCKVNQYESEQLGALLRRRGLVQADVPDQADLRVVHTCSVTIQAASKSRQAVRQLLRNAAPCSRHVGPSLTPATQRGCSGGRLVVSGCWATSDSAEALAIPGVSAVLGHQHNVAEQLDQLLTRWRFEDLTPPENTANSQPRPEWLGNDGWIIEAGTLAPKLATTSRSHNGLQVKRNVADDKAESRVSHQEIREGDAGWRGTADLPPPDGRQDGRQRAFLKIQDGCDACCSYCIIPRLRRRLWSKPVEDVVGEAGRLVEAGHVELVLTGIYLGAYGQPSAVRRRQGGQARQGLPALIDAVCTGVPGLRRLRLSSIESGDLNDQLLNVLRRHPQVVPHFHLPLQSGSDEVLSRMRRQYGRADFLKMVERLRGAFDRPALTTDIIVGFPGESDEHFNETLDVVDRAGFIHIHGFSFSPRPGTAAAQWERDFVRGPVVKDRIQVLRSRAADNSYRYRRQFTGQSAEVMVERLSGQEGVEGQAAGVQHGRCERYFPVWFKGGQELMGRCVKVLIEEVTEQRTFGRLVGSGGVQ